MKLKLVLFILIFISLNSFSQNHLMYKCKNISQKDSISFDLKNKGYKEYVCEDKGIFLNFQLDNTFCFNNSTMGYKEVTLKELYSNVKIVPIQEFEMVVIDNEDLCSEIDVKTDKFTNEISYNSPDIDNISFIKYKKKGVTSQYVSISLYNTYLSGYNNYGLTILFKSGKKIIRSKEKVDVNYSSGSEWRYSVFFTPNTNEINLFKNEEIEAVKLYIFDGNINRGNTIRKYANCVLTSTKTQAKKKK